MVDAREKKDNPEPVSLKVYVAITYILMPLIHLMKPLLALYGGFRDSVPERLGRFSPELDKLNENRGDRDLVYIHAVSVGEAAVAGALVDAIKKHRPDIMIAISTTTFTGRDYILRNLEPDALFFFPLDLPVSMRRLIAKLNPSCFLDIEVELWPNLFRALTDAGVPMALANGRVSDRAANPPAIARSITRWMFRCFDGLFMRSEEDVERAVVLGAPVKQTFLAGNLKFAACGSPPDIEERNRIRDLLGLGESGKLLVAGSTHPGEDEKLIEAWMALNDGILPEGYSPVTLVLAPRHLEQVDRIANLVRDTGEQVALWTDIHDSGVSDDCRAIVVNTIGELMKLYGAADVAFVGGSLIEKGGHNVLEPVAMGVPTLHGPSMTNFHDLKEVLGRENLIIEVADTGELTDSIVRVLKEVDRMEYQSKARALVDSQLRAADMIADWVVSNLR